MGTLDKIKQINADIAALPEEYLGLVELEQSWAINNPGLYAAALLGIGLIFGFVIAVFA